MGLCLFIYFSNKDIDVDEEEIDWPLLLLLTQYLTCLILHIQMQPRLQESINKLYYIRNNPIKFEEKAYPILVCFSKLLVDIFTEGISLKVI